MTSCSDDRFDPDSTVYAKPSRPTAEEYAKADPEIWDGITPEEYFIRAFKSGKQNHRLVQNLRRFFPRVFEKVENQFKGGTK